MLKSTGLFNWLRRVKVDIICLFVCSFGVTAPLPPGGLLMHEVSRSHTNAPQSVGLLWTSDQPVAETSTWQHTTLTLDKYPCPQWDSNPQSEQASGRRPTYGDHWNRCCGGYYDHNNKMAGSVKFGELLQYLGALIFQGTVFCRIRSKNIVFAIMSLSFILFWTKVVLILQFYFRNFA